MFKFYVKHGKLVYKVHEWISIEKSKGYKKNINFNTQKRKLAVNICGKDFYKLLKNAFYGRTLENVRNGTKREFF